MNLTLSAQLQLQAREGEQQRRFTILAYSGGKLHVGGFPLPVVVDLAGLSIPESIPILIDHTKSVEATLGVADQFSNDGQSLSISGTVTAVSALATNVVQQHDQGHRWQASIGAHVEASVEIPAGQTIRVNGQTFTGPLIVATQATLRETSVLPMGADHTTHVNLAAAAAPFNGEPTMAQPKTPTFDEWTTELGIQASALTEERKAAMQLAYEAEIGAPAAKQTVQAAAVTAGVGDIEARMHELTAQSLRNFQEQLAAQQRQHAEIQAKAAGHPEIVAAAIEHGWSIDKVELEVMKAGYARTRPTSFNSAQNAPEQTPKVLEAALCMARRLPNLEKQFDDKTLQAAHSQHRQGIGLQQLLLQAAAYNGMYLEPGTRIGTGNIRDVLAHAFNRVPGSIQAAASTLSVPGILSNVGNKEIEEGYMQTDTVWREIAQIKSVNDFKTVTSYRMLDDMEYEQLGKDGRIKHGTAGEESYTRKANTYAKMFALTREDIINDDLSAFDDLRNRIGRGAGIKLTDLFWTTWLANAATIWTAARTNYISGSTTNLGTDGVGLGLGVKAFRQRRSPSADGSKRLAGTPQLLLVPPELETVADQLFQARNANNVAVGSANIHAGKYRPIVANQLSDSAYTGYSSTHWWLLGDAAMGSPVVVSFLNGQETPIVESADADFDQLGIQFRGYHDFGCDVGEYLNSVYSKGAA